MPSTSPAACPYCGDSIAQISQDHIFPGFLGGRRKIDSCGSGKNCNNTFGHTFEVGAAKYLQQLHVFISSWGLPLRSASPTWIAAHTQEGNLYDLSVGETGVKPELSKASPHIVRDDEGNIVSREFRSRRDAEKFGERLIEKGKAKRFEITALPPPEIDLRGLEITLELGPDIKRLALKMCVAACTLLPAFHHAEVEHARLFLTGARREGSIDIALPAYLEYETLDFRRKPMCHLIYVERARERVYGVVQFFGVVQMFCRLGLPLADRPEVALLSSLDPVTGEESHSEIEPLRLIEPPFAIWIGDYPRTVQLWFDKFRQEANKRGATHPPDLQMKIIDIDKGAGI